MTLEVLTQSPDTHNTAPTPTDDEILSLFRKLTAEQKISYLDRLRHLAETQAHEPAALDSAV